MSRNILILLAALLAILLSGWFYLHSDQRLIRKQLHQLTESAAKSVDETGVEALTKAAATGKIFCETCTVTIEEYDVHLTATRREITEQIFAFRNHTRYLHPYFEQTTISVHGNTAEIRTELYVEQQGGSTGNQKTRDIFQTGLTMRKEDGKWRISAAELTPQPQ